jgi:hypothetical protein
LPEMKSRGHYMAKKKKSKKDQNRTQANGEEKQS